MAVGDRERRDTTRKDAVNQLKSLWNTLNGDVELATAYLRENNTSYAQRALVRAEFSLIEGLSYALRQVTLASLGSTQLIDDAEKVLLEEVSHTITPTGETRSKPRFLDFPASIPFSMRCYAKIHGSSFTPNTNLSGWNSAMTRAKKVRNNITHPKASELLELTSDDLQAVKDAVQWWEAEMLALFRACAEADRYWQKALGTVTDEEQ